MKDRHHQPRTDSRYTVGLVGWPVEHSVSPAMHNAAFEALRLPWHYSLLPAPPGGVRSVLAQIREQGWQGANVTVPHKQAVMACLDGLTASARAIGAVNTISVQNGRLVGHNTDGDGFLAALNEVGLVLTNRAVLVLGAGGGARSVVYALAQAGCAVTLHNRTGERAARLVRDLQGVGSRPRGGWLTQAASLQDLEMASFDLLVNTTSLGMWPNIDASPWPEELAIPAHWTVYDLVYNPEETRLLSQARAAGATPVGGLGMLVHQGALAFELWTGQAPPLEVMVAAAKEALA
jgi:shikimate dehydrogenase